MPTIGLDYEKVMREVNRLKEVAAELQKIQTDAKNALADMKTYFDGRAANAFWEKNELWRNEMKSIEAEINALAKMIKTIADQIQEADKRAAAAASGSTTNKGSSGSTHGGNGITF